MYKVLIVDDEPLMREGMERVIRKACPDFSRIDSARDGDEALTLEVVPDVVITDIRMPNMDGLEFIEQLKAEHPDVIVLMVSGFDEFEYAQRGLKLGVKDYLLKPVDSAELAARLNEAAGMLRQRDRESRRFQDLQRLVEENLPLFRERFYRELISGELPPDAIRRRAEALNLTFASKYYGVAIVRLKPAEDTDNQWTQAMLAAIAEDRKSATPSCAEVHSFLLRNLEFVLIVGWNESSARRAFQAMDQWFLQLAHQIQKQTGISVKIGLGGVRDSIASVGVSYRQAEEAMVYHFSMKSRPLIHYEEISAVSPAADTGEAGRLYKELVLHMKLLESEEALSLLNRIKDHFASKTGLSPNRVKLSAMELVIALVRLLGESGADPGALLEQAEFDPYRNVQRHRDVEELFAWMKRFVERCLLEMKRRRDEKTVSYMEKVTAYVAEHYARPDLSIADIAARLYLSPNYLRQLFRQQSGESFVEYVTRVRMEAALELLKDPSLKIQDVAERVGYEEQRYFSTCFKKYYQMTPTEYREALANGIFS